MDNIKNILKRVKKVYQFVLIILFFLNIVSTIINAIDNKIIANISNNSIQSLMYLFKDNTFIILLLVYFIFEYVRNEINKNDNNNIILSGNLLNNTLMREFSVSRTINIILSSSRASFQDIQCLIDKKFKNDLHINILLKRPDERNEIRNQLLYSNILKWLELKNCENINVNIDIKLYSGSEVLRCYIFDNKRIIAGIYSYKDYVVESNSTSEKIIRHRFYGHEQMLYFADRDDKVGNFLLKKYLNQFNYIWNNSIDYKQWSKNFSITK